MIEHQSDSRLYAIVSAKRTTYESYIEYMLQKPSLETNKLNQDQAKIKSSLFEILQEYTKDAGEPVEVLLDSLKSMFPLHTKNTGYNELHICDLIQ